MKDSTRSTINAFLLKQAMWMQQHDRVPQGFGEMLERYLKEFAAYTGQPHEVAEWLRRQIGINNRIIVASDSASVRSRYAYACGIFREMANRVEGFMPDYRVIAA